MQEIKVSVIMPVYNVADYLVQCMDSVINQTLKEIEIICVDDGSTDGSGAILEEYAITDQRVKVYHQQNKFAGCARNMGLQQANGKYVVFWDSDDFFDAQALEKMYAKCEEDQAEICVCGGNRMDNASGVCYPSGVYVNKKMLPEELPFGKKEIPRYIFNFTTNVPWNKMFLKSFVEEHQLQFQPLRQANDVYFSMMALFLAERITVVEEPLVTYRMNNAGSLTGKASDARFCTREAFLAVWNKLNEYPEFDEAVRQSFANRALSALVYSLRTQWNVQSYGELFELYRGELFETFGISGHDREYFYDEKMADTYEQMLTADAQSFLLYEFRDFEQRGKVLGGKLVNVRAKNRELQGDIRQLKKEMSALKKEIRRLEKIEQSTSYNVGKCITYVPRKVKGMVSRKNSDRK